MPSSDQSLEAYTECLDTVKAFVSEVTPKTPSLCTVVGELNCHLGCLGGVRSDDEPNDRCVLWKSMIDCHPLFVVSLGEFARGTIHTYHSGQSSTTLDYY